MTQLDHRDSPAVRVPDDLDAPPIAKVIGEFAAELSWDGIPDGVTERAKLLILDAVGIALASTGREFAERALAAGRWLGPGDATVIGSQVGLDMRDAAMINGVLVHGLDFDDTHPAGIVHVSASALPTALAVSERLGLTGRDLVLGYVLGLEVSARIGMAAGGGFHQVGFHPTGLVGAFGCAVLAARLRRLPSTGIAAAQGFVGTLASGSLEFLETGAWTKRVHPGWAGVCGITAAAFAAEGFESPPWIYEGRFGLFRTHLGGDAEVDYRRCTDALGERWETMAVAVKPFPACHFTHAFVDAAIALRDRYDLRPGDIARVHCLIAAGEVTTVCEPLDKKRRPQSDYDAQFSLPYVVSAALCRGAFTLAELESEALGDPEILRLAEGVTYEDDPASGFPDVFSGEVRLELSDGRVVSHREQVNRGAGDRPLDADAIIDKYQENSARTLGREQADRLREAVLDLDALDSVVPLTGLLRPPAP